MNDKSQIFSSAIDALHQTPPPSLREILSAYRSKGDGDRDMLIALLNAKSAEDRRMAETCAVYRTMIESMNADQSSPNLPPLVFPEPQHPKLPTLSSGFHYSSGESNSHKRRTSRHAYSPYSRPLSRDSTTPPIQMPPSPYSSASAYDPNISPKSDSKERETMPIASMLNAERKRASSSPSRR